MPRFSKRSLGRLETCDERLQELFKEGLPPIERGLAPVEDWECNPKYCSFYGPCGGGIKGILEMENKWTKR